MEAEDWSLKNQSCRTPLSAKFHTTGFVIWRGSEPIFRFNISTLGRSK
jgi:hypothetical protein